MSKKLLVLPKISEKTLSRVSSKEYVFHVPVDASKAQIKEAIEAQYEVKVGSIRTVVVKGKAKSSMRRRLQPIDGKRKNTKKAYFKLTKGEITILEEA